jgi:hypothetical protein
MTARQCAEGILRVPQVVLRIAKQPHVRNVTISRQKLNGKREKIGCRVRCVAHFAIRRDGRIRPNLSMEETHILGIDSQQLEPTAWAQVL